MPKPITRNTLYYGDNLDILREYIPDESVDLIYLDPPFNSNRSYSVLFKDEKGMDSEAQINAFDDTWHWNERVFRSLIASAPLHVASMLDAMHGFIGENQMMAYLVMMAARLVELHRVLKPTGSLYLHCDPTASHYLKVLLDTIFGVQNYLNEIVWKRTTSHNDPQRYGRIGDRILFYSKSTKKVFIRGGGDYSEEQLKRYKFEDSKGRYRAENLTAPHFSETRTIVWKGTHPGLNRQWRYSIQELDRLYSEGKILLKDDGTPRKDGLKEYLCEAKGQPFQDIWTDIPFPPTTAERLGYPTQKPLALLERIIQASSNPGDVVLDPFSGCGTAIAAAQKLGRQWIGVDITHLAIAMHKSRLKDMYGLLPEKDYDVVGEPVDLNGAKALFKQNPFQFESWAVSLMSARPQGGNTTDRKKQVGDRGIDGVILFTEDARGRTGKIIIQVKGGGVKSGDVRDLRGVIERESAAMGIFLTLEAPSREMKLEADKAGDYHSELWQMDYPRLQIVTIEDLLDGRRPDLPRWLDDPHKKAERVKGKEGDGQLGLEM